MKVAIVGASGYAGGELIRLLVHHSAAKVTCATSRTLAGTPLDQIHPHLKGFTDLRSRTLPSMRLMRTLPSSLFLTRRQ